MKELLLLLAAASVACAPHLAETEGDGEIYRDLRMKLFIDPDTPRQQ